MNAPKSALNQVVDIEIDGIDLTSNANVSFAKKVLSETLGEISSHEQEAIVIRLETIFKQWQLQFGVYPPKPSIQRILESLGHGSVRPAQIAYSQYILIFPNQASRRCDGGS